MRRRLLAGTAVLALALTVPSGAKALTEAAILALIWEYYQQYLVPVGDFSLPSPVQTTDDAALQQAEAHVGEAPDSYVTTWGPTKLTLFPDLLEVPPKFDLDTSRTHVTNRQYDRVNRVTESTDVAADITSLNLELPKTIAAQAEANANPAASLAEIGHNQEQSLIGIQGQLATIAQAQAETLHIQGDQAMLEDNRTTRGMADALWTWGKYIHAGRVPLQTDQETAFAGF